MAVNLTPDLNDLYVGYECLPAGEYKIQITDAEVRESSKQTSQVLFFKYEVIANPQFDGRIIYDNMVLEHYTNPSSTTYGRQKYNTVCYVTGLHKPKTEAQFIGKTMSVLVGVKKDDKGNDANFIKKYLPFSGNNAAVEDDDAPAQSRPKFVK